MVELGLDDRTARLVAGKGTWDELTPILKPYAKNITAAIAYVGSGGAQQLTLAAGSSIIVDASERCVRAGSTDPKTLLTWARSCVKVYSLADLHAKMVLADRTAGGDGAFLAVGSTNVSAASASRLLEAVILTDSDVTLDEARNALVEWKTVAGAALTIAQLEALSEMFGSDRSTGTEGGGREERANGEDDDDEDREPVTPWPRPGSIYIAPTSLQDDASEEAIHRQEELAEQYGCSDDDGATDAFAITMFWWDETTDPDYEPNWKYAEGAHVIVVTGTKSGHIRATSQLTEPGRVVHVYTDSDASPSRTYYYLHTKRSDETHTVKELKAALTAVGVDLDYSSRYQRARVVDALLGIWTDLEYDEG